MQLVATDIVGPFSESSSGNSYILVAADYFTRWVEAYPIPCQEASVVARKLVDEMFCRFSPTEQLLSDQGRQFESQLMAEDCKLLGIRSLEQHHTIRSVMVWWNAGTEHCCRAWPRQSPIILRTGRSLSRRFAWRIIQVSTPLLASHHSTLCLEDRPNCRWI